MAIREQLEAMAKREGIKPSRAALMRKERKAKEDAEQEGTARSAV